MAQLVPFRQRSKVEVAVQYIQYWCVSYQNNKIGEQGLMIEINARLRLVPLFERVRIADEMPHQRSTFLSDIRGGVLFSPLDKHEVRALSAVLLKSPYGTSTPMI